MVRFSFCSRGATCAARPRVIPTSGLVGGVRVCAAGGRGTEASEWQPSQRSTERRRGQTDAATATGICSHTLSVSPPQPAFVTEIDAGHETPDAATASGFFMPFFRVKIERKRLYILIFYDIIKLMFQERTNKDERISFSAFSKLLFSEL